jgi:hypothetical protein
VNLRKLFAVSAWLAPVAPVALLGPARPASAEVKQVFGPGEQIVLDVSYAGIKAGTATITVGKPTKVGTTDVWPIVTVADTESVFSVYPLHDKFVSWWDPLVNRSVGYDFSANESGHQRRERCKLQSPEPGKAQIQRVSDKASPSLAVSDVGPDDQDIAAAFFTLRGLDLTDGAVRKVPVFTGWRRWELEARVLRREKLTVPAGEFDAVALEIDVHFSGNLASQRSLRVWVTDDARRVPLQIEGDLALGSLTAALVEYHPGK